MKRLRTRTNTDPFMRSKIAGPEEGDLIFVKGVGDCKVHDVKVKIDGISGHIYYEVHANTGEGNMAIASFPAEVLMHTGFSWSSSQVPFDLTIERCENEFFIQDLDSQCEYNVEASGPSLALANLRLDIANTGKSQPLGDTVAIHQVYSFTLIPSIQRWMASIKQILHLGGKSQGPLRDCFTHPDGRVTAFGPLNRCKKAKLVEMQMDLESLFKKHIPEGIMWPALSEAELYDTKTLLPLKMDVGE